ncbi:MAG: hypothetical protein AABY00_02805 [Nanoarchaeota archaeon]
MLKGRIGGILFFALFITVQLVHAEIFTGQLDALYNLGDDLTTNITIFSGASKTSFLSINLACDSGKVELYKSPLNVKEGEQKKIPFSTHLDASIIGNTIGICSLQTDYANERGESRTFEITKELITTLRTDKSVYLPGEKVQVTGTSTRKNLSPLKGFVELSVTDSSASVSSPISSGKFNLTLIIPEDAPSRNSIIQVRAYERDDSGLLMNEGTAQIIIKIAQVAKTIDVVLNAPSLQPGEEVRYMVVLTDQAREALRDDSTVVLFNPQGKIVEKKLIKSGDLQTYILPQNATPGAWKIEAKSNSLQGERVWNVKEVANASFYLENNTLTIANTGNVPFKKSVEVSLNGVNEVKDVDLPLGEKKSYKLVAPDGTYTITVSDGTQEKDLGNSFLTGRVIDVLDIDNLTNGSAWGTLLFYGILILALGLIAVGTYRLAVKRKYVGKMPLWASSWNKPSSISKNVNHRSSPVTFSSSKTNKNLGYATVAGKKEECAVLALTVHNIHELIEDDQASDLLDRVANQATQVKASVREDRNTHLMIFSPEKTKHENPSLLAVKVGKEIERQLQEYNQKHALKMRFGIGIHLGEMIVESIQGKEAYHAVGNTVIAAKRAAERGGQQLLLTGPIHRKVSGIVKTQQISAESLWKVNSIVEREDYTDFIDKFMRRQGRQ